MKNIEYTITSEKDSAQSQREISIEVSVETLSRFKDKTLLEVTAQTEIPGFRKGKAPASKILEKFGEMAILERAAEKITNEVTVSVIAEKKLRFIGQPSLAITALAPGNPLRFTVTLNLMPEITLPDYKKIASDVHKKEIPEQQVSEQELAEALKQIATIISREKNEGGKETQSELTEEMIQKLGGFKNLEEFKEKLKKDLLQDKKQREHEKQLLEIIDTLVEKTDLQVPRILIEQELDQMEAEFAHEIEKMRGTLEEYYKKTKRTAEDLRKEWLPNAEKRVKFELIFPRIAQKENLSVSSEEKEHEIKHLLEHQPDIQKELAALHVERVLLRQKVVKFLDSCKNSD